MILEGGCNCKTCGKFYERAELIEINEDDANTETKIYCTSCRAYTNWY